MATSGHTPPGLRIPSVQQWTQRESVLQRVNGHRAAGSTRCPPRDRSAVWKGSGLLRTLMSLPNTVLKTCRPARSVQVESPTITASTCQTPLRSNICVFYCRSRHLITRRPWGSHIEAYLWPNQETEILNRA